MLLMPILIDKYVIHVHDSFMTFSILRAETTDGRSLLCVGPYADSSNTPVISQLGAPEMSFTPYIVPMRGTERRRTV